MLEYGKVLEELTKVYSLEIKLIFAQEHSSTRRNQ